MNKEILHILKEEAEHYAFHYRGDFFDLAKNQSVSFEEHYRNLDFNSDFIQNIIFRNPDLSRYVSEYRLHSFSKNQDQKMMEKDNERFLTLFIKELSACYKRQFAELYLELLQDEISDVKQSLEYAFEDEVYYTGRLYIFEEELLGGPISEEEREESIAKANEQRNLYTAQLEHLKKIEKQLIQVKFQESESVPIH